MDDEEMILLDGHGGKGKQQRRRNDDCMYERDCTIDDDNSRSINSINQNLGRVVYLCFSSYSNRTITVY